MSSRSAMWHYHHRPPARPEAIAEAHECPVDGCRVLCSPGHVVCRRHWRGIPQHLRQPLVASFVMREKDPIGFAIACETTKNLAQRHALDEACSLNAR